MHITVDYTLCEGHGQCLMAAPDVFDLPDGSEQVEVTVPAEWESEHDAVLRAVAMCPAQALRLSE